MYVFQKVSGMTPTGSNLMLGQEFVVSQGPRPSLVHILYGAEERNIVLGRSLACSGGRGRRH